MIWYPFHRFTIVTRMTPSSIEARLKENTEPMRWLRGWHRSSKPFQGTVQPDSFQLMRIIRYRNSFLPVVRGRMSRELGKTRVEVRMQLHWLVTAFVALWSTPLVLFLVGRLPVGSDLDLVIPAGMLLFLYLMSTIGFAVEATRQEKQLRSLLEDDAQ